jgi:hypothetical protein
LQFFFELLAINKKSDRISSDHSWYFPAFSFLFTLKNFYSANLLGQFLPELFGVEWHRFFNKDYSKASSVLRNER